MSYQVHHSDVADQQINQRGIIAVLIGLILGAVFWSVLFLAVAG